MQLIQNNAIGQHFKPAHLQSLAQQSPLINQTQLIAPIQQIPQSPLAWAQPNPNQQIVQSSPQIFIRQPTHTTADHGQLFIQGSNPALQAMSGTPIYVNHNTGSIMQLVSNHTATSNLNATANVHQPILQQTSNQSSKTVAGGLTSNKLKTIKPAASQNSLNNSTQGCQQQKTVKPITSSEKKASKKEQSIDKSSKFSTKSTQQMNAELLALNEKNKLQRSDSIKSLDSVKSKSEGKLLKKQSSSLDDDSSNSMSNLNGSLKKSEKKVKQKAIVKPQILSHCVDGYIIHESSFPFPVNVTEELNDELEQIKLNNGSVAGTEKVKAKKLKKLKLKTSQGQTSPIKNQTTSLNATVTPNTSVQIEPTNSLVEMQSNKKNLVAEPSKEEEPPAPVKERKSNVVSVAPISESSSSSINESNVYSWSVDQVYDYLIKQDVSEAIAKELHKAQINGRSLILLTIPILKDKFMFKLGPILSLKKKIDELKEKAKDINDDYLPASGENIYNWSVKDTYQFILHLSSKEHAEEFERQEMDGHSLTLISTDNIVNDMNIPFGAALAIFHRIEELKKKSSN